MERSKYKVCTHIATEMEESVYYNRKHTVGTLVLCTELKIGERKIGSLEVCAFEETRYIGWCKVGIWRLKQIKGNALSKGYGVLYPRS
jgi:hypothetical protein